jgi:hypothetical protein
MIGVKIDPFWRQGYGIVAWETSVSWKIMEITPDSNDIIVRKAGQSHKNKVKY